MENVIAQIKASHCNNDLHPCKQPSIIYHEPVFVHDTTDTVLPPSTSVEDDTTLPSRPTESSLITHSLPPSQAHHEQNAAVRIINRAWTTVHSYRTGAY
jgi:hypothetical protein